ncbi:hypothetical protein D4R42_04930 [bacterium]|nr:MAG: hypothetical protein D4R42_04930 [bacterium]
MSHKNGLYSAHWWAVKGCPRPVYGVTRVSRIDSVLVEKQKPEQEQAQKKLEELFSSAKIGTA